MTITAFALLAAAAGQPEIQLQPVPGKGYSATVAVIDADHMTPSSTVSRCWRPNVAAS